MKKRNELLIGLIVACLILLVSCSPSPQTSNYLVGDAHSAVGFAVDVPPGAMTAGRARSLVGGIVSLISVIIGGLALSRSAGRAGIVALALGLIGMILSVIHLGTSTGGFGTGGGRAGAIVALVLGLIGVNLGGLTLARSRRSRSPD